MFGHGQHGQALRSQELGWLQRAPQYRPSLAGPYRDHLRKRRAKQPAVPVRQLLREIGELGYQGGSNLLVRYLNQGRAGGTARTSPPPGSTAPAHQARRPHGRPALAVWSAAPLTPDPGNAGLLTQWITADPPCVHALAAACAPRPPRRRLTPHHNGRPEEVNTKTKMIRRRMHGRAGFALLSHRILLV